MIGTYFDEYYDLSEATKSKIYREYDSANLILDVKYYSEQCKEKSGDEEELDDLPPLEGGNEKHYRINIIHAIIKRCYRRKRIKNIVLEKLTVEKLTRLPVLLALIKAENT